MSAKPCFYLVCGLCVLFFAGALVATSSESVSARGANGASLARNPGAVADAARTIVPGGRSSLSVLGEIQVSVPMTTPTPPRSPTRTPTRGVTATYTPSCGGPSPWRAEPTMSVPRALAAGAVVNNLFYVISGAGGPVYTSSVERFDPAANSWTSVAPIPTRMAQARAAVVGTKIYVPGGYNSIDYSGVLSSMQIYDTQTDTWSMGANLPEGRSDAAVASYNGKVYIIGGGRPNGSRVNTVYEYDPVADTYTMKSPLPVSEGWLGAAELNGLIYVVGGYFQYAHYAYNPVTDTWATIAIGPTGSFVSPGVFALGGQLWVVGGGMQDGEPFPPEEQVQIYNPEADNWYLGPQLIMQREASSAAGVVNGRGYIAGGQQDYQGNYLNSVESVTYLPCSTITATATATATTTATATATRTENLPNLTGSMAWIGVCPGPEIRLTTSLTYRPGGYVPATIMHLTNGQGQGMDFPVPPLTADQTGTALFNYDCYVGQAGCMPSSWAYTLPLTLTVDYYNVVQESNENDNTAVLNVPPPAPTPCGGNSTPTPTPTPECSQPLYWDVPSGSTFYPYIQCLGCRGIVSGYGDGSFRPENNITRGQISKVVSNAAGFQEPVPSTQQTYTDVPPSNNFWIWIERLSGRGIMGGYRCGAPGEPCDPQFRAYFRWAANATRAQLSKIVSNADYIQDPIPSTQQTFEDVPPSNTFWLWIERLASRQVMGGYPCGGPGERCVPPQNRPYFRPYNNVTRGQASKIVANTFYPACQVP